MLNFSLGNLLMLTLRVYRGLKGFLGNWDLKIGSLSFSYCYHRHHRLGIGWRPIERVAIDGRKRFTFSRYQRYWAFGQTQAYENNQWVARTGPIWKLAFPDRHRGKWLVDAPCDYDYLPDKLSVTPRVTLDGRSVFTRPKVYQIYGD